MGLFGRRKQRKLEEQRRYELDEDGSRASRAGFDAQKKAIMLKRSKSSVKRRRKDIKMPFSALRNAMSMAVALPGIWKRPGNTMKRA